MGARSGLVAMLIAAELLILGLIIYSVGGMRNAFGSSMHHLDYAAGPPVAPIAAGDAPRVSINDGDDRIVITPSTDGQVHVTDESFVRGWSWSSVPIKPLNVSRTSDGVRIERASEDSSDWMIIGDARNRIAVQVPPAATIAIEDSSGADITGITGGTSVKSTDGHITLAGLRGNVDAKSTDSYVEADDVQGDSVSLQADGHVKVRATQANNFQAVTDDGHIDIAGLQLTGTQPRARIHTDSGPVKVAADFASGGSYEVSTNDDGVALTLAPGADLTVSATANDGNIVRDGQVFHGDDSVSQTFTLGGGSGHLAVSSGDGSIKLTTNGAI